MLRAMLFGLCLLAAPVVRGDIIFYRIPGIERTVLLQGSATVNSGGSVTYQHPQMGTLYFDIQDTRINRVPTQQTIFQRKLRSAEGNADKLMEAAHWALRNGLLPSFYTAAEKKSPTPQCSAHSRPAASHGGSDRRLVATGT